MADNTGIAWTDATWNPVTGCTKVSSGCKHCYAERDWGRLARNPKATAYFGRSFTEVRVHPERLEQPWHWKRPRRIFVNSMSDLFHEDVPEYFLDQVFAIMALAPRHTFQILTKRPERMHAYLDDRFDNRQHAVGAAMLEYDAVRDGGFEVGGAHDAGLLEWPLSNVWLGVSVEDQGTADARIPLLVNTPAAVRWVSAEPLLGPINMNEVPVGMFGPLRPHGGASPQTPRLGWVVVGGESGPHARLLNASWVRTLRNQCHAVDVPFFVKQLGAKFCDEQNGIAGAGLQVSIDDEYLVARRLYHRAGADPSEWAADLQVRQYPNPAAEGKDVAVPKWETGP